MPIFPSFSAPTDATTQSILLVEGYDALAVAISSALKKFAPIHTIRVARSFPEAEAAAAELKPELFVLDLDPAPEGDVDFLVKLQRLHPEARVLVIAAGTSREMRAERGPASAVHFIEKPFDLGEFGAAVQALLGPWATPPADSFRGTLRDLHVVDIVQLKCLAMSNAVVHLETPMGQSGEIHFQHGEITHASTGNLTGVLALAEIVGWPGGKMIERELPEISMRTIPDQPWSALLLEAVRKTAEIRPVAPRSAATPAAPKPPGKTILAIDDTEMLLIFAEDVLSTADSSLKIVTALTGSEGLKLAASLRPDLILLDYSLTEMTGADVARELLQNETTAHIPVLMMSGHLPELVNTAATYGNVVATLPKPFLSGALIEKVAQLLAAGPLPPGPDPVSPKPPSPPAPPAVKTETPAPSSAAPPDAQPSNGHSRVASAAPAPIVFSAPTRVPSAAAGSRPPEREVIGSDVSVTIALAVVAMQLRPDFRMDSMHLKALDAPVGVRVADGGELGMLVETGFRMGPMELTPEGKLGTLLLIPTSQPARLTPESNAFAVNTVRAQPGAEDRVVELTAAPTEAMRVHLAARFEFVTVELSPSFEIVAVTLRAREGEAQIGPGVGSTGVPFAIERAEVDETGRLRELFVRSRTR